MTLGELAFYGGILVLMCLTGVGLPVPEEVVVLGAGTGSALNPDEFRWWLAYAACVIGIVATDFCLYGAGRWFGKPLLDTRLIRWLLPEHRRDKITEGFHRHGVKILLTARLLPGIRTGVYLTAGAIRYSWIRFLIADGVYAVPVAGFIFALGYFGGDSVKKLVLDGFHQVHYWLLITAILIAIGLYVYREFRFTRERGAADDFHPPSLPEIVHPKSHPSTETPASAPQHDQTTS